MSGYNAQYSTSGASAGGASQMNAQGYQNSQGYQSAQGNQGYQSAQSYQGTQGTQGNQGNQGTQGYQGNQGTQGYPSAQGAQGASTGQQDALEPSIYPRPRTCADRPPRADKGVDTVLRKLGHGQSTATTEKISDGIRSVFKKVTGKDIPIKDQQ